MQLRQYIYILLGAAFLTSCSATKYVAEGEYLLDKVGVEVDDRYEDIDEAAMKSHVEQKENARWFSSARIPLGIYSLSGRDSSKWINRTLRKMGEAPVILDSLKTELSIRKLRNELQNKGYLGAYVRAEKTVKGKKARLNYVLNPGYRYFVRSIKYDIQDSAIAMLPMIEDESYRLIKMYMPFDAQRLDDERKRLTQLLANNGYYKFNKDYITYQADTMPGVRDIDLTLVMRQFRTRSNVDTLHSRYKIGKVRYLDGEDGDTVVSLRRKVLANNTFIAPGEYYSAADLAKTYSRFGRLQAVKYTNIGFVENSDSNTLDCNILLSTNKPNTISIQPEGTNTAGDLGAALSVMYQNRNLFRGSELLSIELRGAFEAIRGLEGYGNANFEEYMVETSLMFPRFIAPLLSKDFRRKVNATSEVSLAYDLQNRPEYHRRVLSAAWRYKWNSAGRNDRFQLDLLDVNYVFMPWISERFRQDYLEDNSNRNAIVRYNYEDLFIMKLGFMYSYSNNLHALKANVETAGNVLGLLANATDFKKNDLGQYKLFNIAYAQYVKGDVDYTKYFRFDRQNTLVVHAALGVAYPYGNSTILPFEKRYFSGGANSVRGWSVRSLGPGKYQSRDGNIDFINQTGDLKLDFNLEYRTHLFWKLDGALFVDAGNIWTLRYYDEQPGGQFDITDFYEQIAVGYGLGFRFNFDFFILRFDMGMKAIDPAHNGERHYPIVRPRMSRDFTFHFAVGLPF